MIRAVKNGGFRQTGVCVAMAFVASASVAAPPVLERLSDASVNCIKCQ